MNIYQVNILGIGVSAINVGMVTVKVNKAANQRISSSTRQQHGRVHHIGEI